MFSLFMRGYLAKHVHLNKINFFADMIRRKTFTEKDLIYVKAAEKIKDMDMVLIAYEWHFRNADSCLEQPDIIRLDFNCAIDFLDAA